MFDGRDEKKIRAFFWGGFFVNINIYLALGICVK